MSRIVRQIHAGAETPDGLRRVLDETRELLQSDASTLYVYDASREVLDITATVGGDESLVGRSVPIGKGLASAAAQTRTTLRVENAPADPRFLALSDDYEVRDLLVAPMVRHGELIGALEVLNRTEGAFDDVDARILELLAEQLAVHIEHTRLTLEKVDVERRAALGNVAAGLAHYINNVLGQWKGSATLIDIGLQRGDLEMVAGAWPLLRRSHGRITLLVQDMLELAKPRQPHRTRIDIGQVARQVVDAEKERARRLGVRLILQARDVPLAWVDRVRIYELVTNLVTNALDAIEENGGTGSRIEVRVSGSEDGEGVEIVVADDGPGIPPHVRSRVFDPFFSTKGSRGTGLGLSLVAKTVQEHGGQVTVEDREGGGTVFRLRLPLAGAPLSAEPPLG